MTFGQTKLLSTLLLVIALIYGVIAPVGDFGPSHASHPEWPPHARFHMVWLLGTGTILALFTFFLVLMPGENRRFRLQIASLLGIAATGGFWIAAALRPFNGGGLRGPDEGMQPILGIDLPIIIFGALTLVQLSAVWLAFKKGA